MQSSGNLVRVRLKVSTQLEVCGTGDSVIWFLVNKRTVRTIGELELKLAEHLGIRSRYWCNSKLIQLWLDDGLLPKYESVHILQNGDTIRVIVDNTTPNEVQRNSRSQNSSNLHKAEAAAASTPASSYNSRCSTIPKDKTSETSNAALSSAVHATQQRDGALGGGSGSIDDMEFVIKLEPQSGDEDTLGDVEASSEDVQGLQIAAVYSIPAVDGPSASVDSDGSRLIPCPSSAATELDSCGKEMLPDIISTESIPHVPWHRAVRNVKPSTAVTVARTRRRLARHDVWSTPVYKRKHCKSYACLRCDKQFTSPYHLQAHVKFIHSAKQRYFCSDCKASFTIKRAFRQHAKIHERGASHRRSPDVALRPRTTCSVLPRQRNQTMTETKAAARNTRLQSTVSISRQTKYFGEKRRTLQCQKCNRRFVHQGHLTLHMRWLHAERYCCQYCGLMILSVDWKGHMLLHAASKTVTVSIADLKLGTAAFESVRNVTVQSRNVLQGPRSKLTNDMKISLQSFWNAGTRSWKLNQQTGSLAEPSRQLT